MRFSVLKFVRLNKNLNKIKPILKGTLRHLLKYVTSNSLFSMIVLVRSGVESTTTMLVEFIGAESLRTPLIKHNTEILYMI